MSQGLAAASLAAILTSDFSFSITPTSAMLYRPMMFSACIACTAITGCWLPWSSRMHYEFLSTEYHIYPSVHLYQNVIGNARYDLILEYLCLLDCAAALQMG